jgi:type IV secretory pathway TrbF-like protein
MSTLEVALDDRQAVSKPDGEENPYLSARRTWNSQVERAFAAAHTWQIIGIIGMLIGLGGVGGMVWLGSLPRFTPYIIEVDKLGEAVAVRPADRAAQADNPGYSCVPGVFCLIGPDGHAGRGPAKGSSIPRLCDAPKEGPRQTEA